MTEVPEDVKDLFALMEADRHADLLPELENYVYEMEGLGGMKALKHPLCFEVPFFSPGQANRRYLQQSRILAEAEEASDWHTCIFVHERAYRTDALLKYVIGVNDFDEPVHTLATLEPEFRDYVRDVWTDSENIAQNIPIWNHIFDVPDDCGLLLGDAEEFAELPDEITVYRGDCPDGGWSWSTDRAIAEFFAKRWNEGWPLLTGTVEKKYVFGYLTNRGESEIMVNPKHVTVLTTEAVAL